MMIPQQQFDQIFPFLLEWATSYYNDVQQTGNKLGEREIELAKFVGVASPELIRVKQVSRVPTPYHVNCPQLAQLAQSLRFSRPFDGITFGYSILIRNQLGGDERLLKHEFRHVYQTEQAGSLETFLRLYAIEVITHGYGNDRYELDAKAHET